MARNPKSTGIARSLRKENVPAEALLWKALRNRALAGFKFRRQHPVGPYIADFACVASKIIVEADGESHLTDAPRDSKRTRFLEENGWLVLRFWNTQVYDELEGVKEAIYRICMRRSNTQGTP